MRPLDSPRFRGGYFTGNRLRKIALPMAAQRGAAARARGPVAAEQLLRVNLVAAHARIDWRQTLHTNACCSREWAGESLENRRAEGRESIKICESANASRVFW